MSEANGRASIYLAALASNLIALAFIGQMPRLGTAFYAFALILLPVLAFVGTVTFMRLVQSSVEDIAFAHRIALLRSYYLRIAPELEPYLVVVREARPGATANDVRLAAAAWQLTLTAAGMVAVVNSVVVAACAGLVLVAAGVDSLAIPVAVGALVGAGAFSLHERHHRRALDASSPETVDRAAISVTERPELRIRKSRALGLALSLFALFVIVGLAIAPWDDWAAGVVALLILRSMLVGVVFVFRGFLLVGARTLLRGRRSHVHLRCSA